jgi:hypothetical protein
MRTAVRFLDGPVGTRYTAREDGDMRLNGKVAIIMGAGSTAAWSCLAD